MADRALAADVSTLVLLPGWGFNHRVWDTMSATLRNANMQTRCPDLHIPAEKVCKIADWCIDDYTYPLVKYLTRPCVLVGWSLGGLVAIRLARQLPGIIRAVVLLASTPCFYRRFDWPYGFNKTEVADLTRRIKMQRQSGLSYFCNLVACGDSSPRKTVEILREAVIEDERQLLHGLHVLAHEDLRQDLSAMTCPAAIILGANDKLIDPAVADEINRLKPDTYRAIIRNTGHAPFAQGLDETVLHIREFLCEFTG